jgi:hypothetical protein
MLTYDDLKRAASLMDAYGERRPGYLESDAARQSGPAHTTSAMLCTPREPATLLSRTVEVVQDPVTQAWRIKRA